MSLWDFVGGAADSMLDKRKRDMAAQLQKDLEEQRKNFQMTLEQQRAEREQDRYNMDAESKSLDRMREDERYEKESAAREAERKANEAYRNEGLALRRSESASAAAARREAAEERGLARKIQLMSAGLRMNDAGDLERDPDFIPPADKKAASESLNKRISSLRSLLMKPDNYGVKPVVDPSVSGALAKAQELLDQGRIEEASVFLNQAEASQLGGTTSAPPTYGVSLR